MVVELHEFYIVFNVRSDPYSKANITRMVLSAMCSHCDVKQKSEIKQLSTCTVSHAIEARLKETENCLVAIYLRKIVPASSLSFIASCFQNSG